MIQRGLIFFFLFVFFSSPLYPFDTQTLSQNRQWQQLLHFHDGESEIDAADFFLSPLGKTDAKAELDATLGALVLGEDIACRFPDRVWWLHEKVPTLSQKVAYKPCADLEEHLRDLPIVQGVVVFPSAHINAPASMFGHTFLRLDDEEGLPLMSQAVNYAAKTPKEHGFLYAYRGLFGAYEGHYSVLPYYQKIKEYNKLEQRDLWEYTLNLTAEEIVRLQRHLYALRHMYADYYFMKENCSYNLLWLLEVARPKSRLISQFHLMATPMDTLKVLHKEGFITKSTYRPSKSKELLALLQASEQTNAEVQEAYKAQVDVGLLQLARSQGKIAKKPYVKKLMGLLAARSRLPKVAKPVILSPENPLDSHASHKMTMGVDSANAVSLDVKLAYHDIYDVDRGFSQGAYIDFLHLRVKKSEEGRLEIEKFDVLDMQSYAVRDAIFKPFSWAVSFGMARFRDETSVKIVGAYGLSYALGKRALGFIMMGSKFYYHDRVVLGVSPRLGVLAGVGSVKLGVLGERNFYSDGGGDVLGEAFVTWMFHDDMALNLKVNHDKIEYKKSTHILAASLFYYF